MSLKPSILEQEKDFDDIFFVKDDDFFCFKARNGETGKITDAMVLKYITKEINASL